MAIAAALAAHNDNMTYGSDAKPPDLDSHPSPNSSKTFDSFMPSSASLPALSRAYHANAPPPSPSACLILDRSSNQPLPASLKFGELPPPVQHQLIVARCLAAQPDGPPGLPTVHLPYQPDAALDPLEFGVFHVPLTPYERNRLLPLAVHLATTTKPDQKLRVPLKRLPSLPFRTRDDVLRALSDLVEDAAAHIHRGVPPVRAEGIRARVPQQATTIHRNGSATRHPMSLGSGHPLGLLRRRAAGETVGSIDWARMRVLALKEVGKVQASCGEVNVMRFVDNHRLAIGSKAPTNQRDPGNLVLAHLPSHRILTPPVHRSFRYIQVDPDHPILGGRFVADVTEAAVVRDNRVIIGAEDGAVTLVDAVTGEVLHEWSPVAHPLELDVYDFAAYAVKDVVAHHVQNHIAAATYPDGSLVLFDTDLLETFVFPLRFPGPAMRIVFGHGASNNYLFAGTARRTQSHRRDAMPAGIYRVNWTTGELDPLPTDFPPRPIFPVKNCDIASLALNPTGDLLVAATYSNFDTGKGDGMVRVFQVPELELVREWYAGVVDVNVVGFSDDSRYVYAACPDNFTLVYDMECDGDNPLGVLPHDDASTNVDDMHRSDGVTDAIWHRAASLLVTASAADDTVRFWDVAKLDPNRHGERSRTARSPRDWFPDLDARDALVHVLHPNHGPVLRLAIAPNELTLVAGTSSGAVVFAGRPLSDQVEEVPAAGVDDEEDGDAMDVDLQPEQQPPADAANPGADDHGDVDPWPRTVLVMPA
ncbi:hypothetical protein AMAG_15180 [Allomyces macrogynus ATCC 38327]|uniref:Uncharacterized protein n=1 Tax=Allomyces macrogynus (strain ATCC 38327) TaxID=578462 RepID=A0A0L0T698_ALLM3|nr:hypothetical protein AMAG_15180 [Allomyces macrogynus ATCC 38327]|eukprot:KNE70211.1 hypothetical protein AMAG_15180 [Allomyces macrogynus ATCC 38327]